jgi:hypothetical protein
MNRRSEKCSKVKMGEITYYLTNKPENFHCGIKIVKVLRVSKISDG